MKNDFCMLLNTSYKFGKLDLLYACVYTTELVRCNILYRIEKSNKMKLSVFLSCFNLPLLFRSVQTVIHSWAVHKREFGSTATYLNILSWFYSHKQCIS